MHEKSGEWRCFHADSCVVLATADADRFGRLAFTLVYLPVENAVPDARFSHSAKAVLGWDRPAAAAAAVRGTNARRLATFTITLVDTSHTSRTFVYFYILLW